MKEKLLTILSLCIDISQKTKTGFVLFEFDSYTGNLMVFVNGEKYNQGSEEIMDRLIVILENILADNLINH
jgi:hypothetical protein